MELQLGDGATIDIEPVRKLNNQRAVRYRQDGAVVATAGQAGSVFRKLATLTGMDRGEGFSFELKGGDGRPLVRVATDRYGKRPGALVSNPQGEPLGALRFLKAGMAVERADGTSLGRVEAEVRDDEGLVRQAFVDGDGAVLAWQEFQVPMPKGLTAMDAVSAIDFFADPSRRTSTPVEMTRFRGYRLIIEKAPTAALAPFILALPIALTFGSHLGTKKDLPEA